MPFHVVRLAGKNREGMMLFGCLPTPGCLGSPPVFASSVTSFQYDTIFSPIKDAMSVKRKKSLMGVAGSLKTNMPIKTVPTAPIPVQMAYAVPNGKVCTAFASNVMLNMVEARKPLPHR